MNQDKFTDIFIILIAIAIIVLKITNVITISWFWLLCPFWGCLVIGAVFAIIMIVAYIIHDIRSKKNVR